MNIDRRRFVGSAAGMAATTGVAANWYWPKHSVSYRTPRSLVAVLNAAQYSEVEALLMGGREGVGNDLRVRPRRTPDS